MSSAPRVSVITPFLDPEPRFLAEAVEGVLEQTFESWELLLVNDGSGPEATREAEEWAARHPDRIRILEHPDGLNRGHSVARNLGLARARGEFVAFLDADDLWLPHRLADHIALLDAHESAGMVFGPTTYWRSWAIDGDDVPEGTDFTPQLHLPSGTLLPPPGPLPGWLTGKGAVPCTCALTVRRSVAQAVGGFEPEFRRLYEDQVFLAKTTLHTSVLAIGSVGDLYRQNPSSVTQTAAPKVERYWRQAFLEWLEDYAERVDGQTLTLQRAIRTELWALDHPRGARILRGLRSLRRRLRPGGQVPIHLSGEGGS